MFLMITTKLISTKAGTNSTPKTLIKVAPILALSVS